MKTFLPFLLLFILPLVSTSQESTASNCDNDVLEWTRITSYEIVWRHNADESSRSGLLTVRLENNCKYQMKSNNPDLILLWREMLRKEKEMYFFKNGENMQMKNGQINEIPVID